VSVNQRSVLTPRVVPKDYAHRPPSLNACAAAMSPRVWETVDYVLGHAKARSSSAEPGRRTPLVLHAACRPRLQPHEPHKPAQPSRLRITRPASAAQLSLRRRAARWAPHMRALSCSRAAPRLTALRRRFTTASSLSSSCWACAPSRGRASSSCWVRERGGGVPARLQCTEPSAGLPQVSDCEGIAAAERQGRVEESRV